MLYYRGLSTNARLVLLTIASVVLMSMDHQQRHLETIRSALSTIVYPIQLVVDLPAALGNWASETLSSHEELLHENERLRAERLLLQGRLQKYEALVAENERLRNLLHSSKRVEEDVLIGELLAVDQDPFKRQILINKGSRDGVYESQPLIDAHGVMGQVIHVAPLTSNAILLTDPSHAIPVQINRNGLRAIALGTGAPNQLEIPHIPNNADIQVGDLLVTSGLGQRFPPGYPVGRITAIEKDPTQPYARVTAEAAAQLERSREVLLVGTQRPAEPTP